MRDPLTSEEISTLIEAGIQNLALPKEPALLYEPMTYILNLGGKRLRPLLVLMSYNVFKDNPEHIVSPALSVELFHNFSLIHDDIMDKAPVRRGKDTVHIKWNEDIGILSGDGMLVKAYKMLESVHSSYLPAVFTAFNKTALEVCEGQQYDMDFESRSLSHNQVTEAEYLNMIRLKTSVLFGLSLQLGALLAGAERSDSDALYEAGVHMGLAFQLQDDLLDLYGGDKFGKIPGGDIINAKKTFMLVKTLELASTHDAEDIVATIESSTMSSAEKIAKIEMFYNQYGIPQLVQNEINLHLKNFKDSLISINSSRSAGLIELVLNLANRTV